MPTGGRVSPKAVLARRHPSRRRLTDGDRTEPSQKLGTSPTGAQGVVNPKPIPGRAERDRNR